MRRDIASVSNPLLRRTLVVLTVPILVPLALLIGVLVGAASGADEAWKWIRPAIRGAWRGEP